MRLERNDIVEMIVAAIMRCGLLPGFSSGQVAQNKWGSMHDALAGQVGGFMIHNLAGKAAEMTYRVWQDGDVPDEHDDIRLVLKKKAWRTRDYCQDVGRRKRAALTLFTSTPIDHCWRHIQVIEESGAALLDLQIERLSRPEQRERLNV